MFNLIREYIFNNKIIVIVGGFFLFSTILKSTTGIDICIPCIWKKIFGFQCPGCGLTTAFISLIKLDFKTAFESNWLIFIILPAGFYYVMKDYAKFSRK